MYREIDGDKYIKVPETGIDDLSDGFHTFRQLYYQRMILFATIVKQNKDKAWKSLRHEDGEHWSEYVHKVKHGRWKREVLGSTSGYGTTVMFQCSKCEKMSISKYHYCPNCGAQMEVEQDG